MAHHQRTGTSNGKDYFAVNHDNSSDSESERPPSFSSTHSADRLVNSSPGKGERSPRVHISARSSGRSSQYNSAPENPSYAPSLMDIPQEPAIDGPARYHDSLVNPPPEFENPIPPVTPLTGQQFLAIVDEVRAAINDGIYPTLISQGSSGSYFCRNREGEIVGVFKPKNEEPYGHLNPKWTKWIHKNLFPCCFGRSCIIPNLGYISEAAASYVDRRLQLNVVPRTEVVYLASPTFYYSRRDWSAYRKGKPLPEKVGSFQVFLKGFKDATRFFREGYERMRRAGSASGSQRGSAENLPASGNGSNPYQPYEWSDRAQKEFQWGFERLVVLDYLIRNTDRGLDNWMVKFDEQADENEKRERAAQAEEPVSVTLAKEELVPKLDSGATNDTTVATLLSMSIPSVPSEATLADGTVANVESSSAIEVTTADCRPSPSSVVPGVAVDVPDQTTDLNHPPPKVTAEPLTIESITSDAPNAPSQVNRPPPIVQIAAIDNGLAFPWKHPDRWRSYPYGWAYLPAARVPFSRETRILVLHLLTSPTWWRETMDGLERLFRIDPDFSETMWRRQRAVVRGEGYNLVETLRRSEVDGRGGSPWGLVRRPVVAVFEEEIVDESEDGDVDRGAWAEGVMGGPNMGMRPGRRRSFVERQGRRFVKRVRQRFETFARSRPCFENW
ncbi:hypothetical protein SpCBS45565_g03182 [Spizellomyces sp. 'palustris']|nr:hypothetical protein SpCBS45565_g03182 [Spizellomyces sp. 'palustris']